MKKDGNVKQLLFVIIFFAILFGIYIQLISAVDPAPPDVLSISSNTTRSTPSAKIVNISGGYIANMNLTATVQDVRWKAFVGNVIGKFTLQDSSGAQIYDWNLASNTGRVYASRNTSSPSWTNINCSNLTTLNAENALMEHINVNDNLTVTFNITYQATHSAFYVGSKYLPANRCPTLNTYKDNATQDTDFEEMALFDESNIVYATILENDMNGYNSLNYDFQMIVPENGNSSFSGATAYYLYVEIGT
jgi:hypothetical protein